MPLEKKDIVMALIDAYAGGNKAKFAKLLDVSPQTVSAWISRNTLDYDLIFTKCVGISADWLLSGKGEMMVSGNAKKKVPLYGNDASIGGNNDMVANVNDPARVTEYIDTGDWFNNATAAIYHYGDSMVEYPSGCILALKRVADPRLIINGENYVIETDEFRITKKVLDDGDCIMAYSSNRETYPDGRLIHAPIRIPKDAIRHMDLVLGCVIKHFSNGPLMVK